MAPRNCPVRNNPERNNPETCKNPKHTQKSRNPEWLYWHPILT